MPELPIPCAGAGDSARLTGIILQIWSETPASRHDSDAFPCLNDLAGQETRQSRRARNAQSSNFSRNINLLRDFFRVGAFFFLPSSSLIRKYRFTEGGNAGGGGETGLVAWDFGDNLGMKRLGHR